MNLFGSTKTIIDKTKKCENVTALEVIEEVLVQGNLVNNQYQKVWGAIYFHSIESYFYLQNGEPRNLVFSQTYEAFGVIIIQFTKQNIRKLEIEDKLNLAYFFLLIDRKATLFYRTKNKKLC